MEKQSIKAAMLKKQVSLKLQNRNLISPFCNIFQILFVNHIPQTSTTIRDISLEIYENLMKILIFVKEKSMANVIKNLLFQLNI
jgi:hypothetical protein